MKTAINLCFRSAQDLLDLDKDTVLISINDPNEPPATFSFDDKVAQIHRQTFADLTTDKTIVYKGLEYPPIKISQAREIIQFIVENKDKNFLVHCRAGISRSGAICLFLANNFGHKLKGNFWSLSDPNPFIYGMLQIQYDMMRGAPAFMSDNRVEDTKNPWDALAGETVT